MCVCERERRISVDLWDCESVTMPPLASAIYKDHLYLSNLSSSVVEISVIVELDSFTFLS